MAQFATADELADRLGITLTVSEETRADSLLTLASGLIQQETRQTIERAEDDVLTRRGTAESRVRLPERPVESVSAVTLDGVAVSSDEWYVDGDRLVRGRSLTGFGGVEDGGWGHPGVVLAITYTHGYATTPDLVKAICLEATIRAWVNPASVQAETYGGEQVNYGDYRSRAGLLLTAAERQALGDALRRTSTSMALR